MRRCRGAAPGATRSFVAKGRVCQAFRLEGLCRGVWFEWSRAAAQDNGRNPSTVRPGTECRVRVQPRRRGSQLRRAFRPHPRHRRRIGVGQVGDVPVHHAPRRAHERPHRERPRHVPARVRAGGPDGRRRAHDACDPRQRDRDDLPGADDLAQSGLHGRRPDQRDAACSTRGEASAAARGRSPAAARTGAPRRRQGVAGPLSRISSRAACASG